MDTIFALATAPGKAGVAVVRISGPKAHIAAELLAGRRPPLRKASLCRLKDSSGAHLDSGLVLLFPQGASFTGEPVAELQLHGARATVAAVLRSLSDINGLRQAEPGEFTRRALENGVMDLTEVEGLADLIEAETEAQRRQALRVLSGDLADIVAEWRSDLIGILSLVEVTIDFADEEVPVDVTPDVSIALDRLIDSLSRELAGISTAERVRDGFEVAIVGPSNIGKSTLLNRLARREAALVSDIAGTTRDIVEVRMDLGGVLVTFLDTAGMRLTDDVVENLGISRAKARAEEADLRIILTDGTDPVMPPRTPQDLVVHGKGDLLDGCLPRISGLTGAGVAELLDHVREVFSERVSAIGTATTERHRTALKSALQALESARDRLGSLAAQTDLVAEDLRQAVRALDTMTGRIDAEDVLDQIFSAFCLGK
ncbi:MAG: tRNA uridine-5-carboxymethylaminomethyl(34) synthesis GTPase MnmE [Pseudomonadota bacterium]